MNILLSGYISVNICQFFVSLFVFKNNNDIILLKIGGNYMSGIYADPSRMTQDGNDTIDSADEFFNEIRALDSSVHELLSIWHGDAATAFKKSFDSKTKELMNFQNVLEARGENIVQSAKILDKNEQELASLGSNLFR